MDPRGSLAVYPRQDTVYLSKSSLHFETIRSNIYKNREKSPWQTLYRWFAHFCVGVATGTIAFLMAIVEESITEARSEYTQTLLDENSSMGLPYLFYTSVAVACALFATLITVFIGPGATGSGVAEIMALLNGVNYPNVVRVSTLWVKAVGVVFAVCGALAVGKEGPLCHIGTILGILVIYAPFKPFRYF